jgi:hypothetical protein
MTTDYVDNYNEADNIDGFEDSNELFDKLGEIESDNSNNNIASTNNAVVVNDDAVDDIPRAQKTPNELIFNTETLIIISLLIIMEI